MLFTSLTLRGVRGRLSWGYRTAADLSTWTIRRPEGPDPEWTLVASVVSADGYGVRQRPLLFTAPRQGGFWCWPVQQVHRLIDGQLIARLGPPEH